MTLCVPAYNTREQYLKESDILIRKTYCSIYMYDEGESILSGGPSLVDYTVSQKEEDHLKIAYVKLGSVGLGWFSTSASHGICIEKKDMPQPFKTGIDWPSADKYADCDVEKKIKTEFGINISDYL